MEPKLDEETIKKHPQNDCFDCNICLESATDPVVTLCGHLYCWPCIYKWLQQSDEGNYPRHCPICKAILSLDTLVPLYARGGVMNNKNYQTLGIPCRPSGQHHRAVAEPRTQQGYDYPHPLIHYRASEFGYSSAVGMAVLPWVMGSRLPASMFDVNPYGGSSRNRNREMEVERSLQQIWQFLVFFAALCFLLF